MSASPLHLLAATVLGFGLGAACLAAWSPRPASAQIGGQPSPGLSVGQPLTNPLGQPFGISNLPQTQPVVQPVEVQALDAQHFVVATREPRLVVSVRNNEGVAQNMILPVVTHYTVAGDRLIPVEHVRVPLGYRLVQVEP